MTNDYHVPRQPGLYWVIWVEGEEPTIGEHIVHESRGIDINGNPWVYLYKYWTVLGDDCWSVPDFVLHGPIHYATSGLAGQTERLRLSQS